MLRRLFGKARPRKRKAGKAKKKKRAVKRSATRKKTRGKKKKGRARKAKPSRGREIQVGVVNHYFPHVGAAVFKVRRSPISVGDKIVVQGHTTAIKQRVSSMQIDRKPIQKARPGQEIGLQVKKRVRINDKVLLLR